MKCPNCNAEIQGLTCGYCGTQIQSNLNPQIRQLNNHINIDNKKTSSRNKKISKKNKSRVYSRGKHSSKKKSVAITLCCLSFIGLSGLHRFYVGKKASGIAHLFTFGFFWIGTVIDLVSLSKGNFTDCNGLKLK